VKKICCDIWRLDVLREFEILVSPWFYSLHDVKFHPGEVIPPFAAIRLQISDFLQGCFVA
jgi:hypothetical protein